MKLISFILSIYLLSLTCYPCTDNDTCADEQKAGIALTDVDHHEHSSQEADHCSPLCTCSCCATIFQVTESVITIPVHIKHNTFLATPYIQGSFASDIHAIWQPPRIS